MKLIALFLICALGTSAQPPRHWYKDKKWWAGEAVILGMAATQGIATSRVKSGGTFAFGNHTSNAKIALFEAGVNVPVFTGLHIFEWHLGHNDPNKYWRFTSYAAVPAADAAIGLWLETHYNWGHHPARSF